MWALGARRFTLVATATLGLLIATVSGALLAAAVAVAMSPLGSTRRRSCRRPFSRLHGRLAGSRDGLCRSRHGSVCNDIRVRLPTPRPEGRLSIRPALNQRPSSIAKSAAAAGLSVQAVTGLRFALERGHGRSGSPSARPWPAQCCRRRSGGHSDLRRRSLDARLPPEPVRVELELRHLVGAGQRHPAGCYPTLVAGEGGRGLVRIRLCQHPDRRRNGPGHDPDHSRCRGPPDTRRPRCRHRPRRSSSGPRPSPCCTRRSETACTPPTAQPKTSPSTCRRPGSSWSAAPRCRPSALRGSSTLRWERER